MKFNFKKVASVIASAVMIGSTAGTALAANYPAPFVVGGVADAAVVVTSGSHVGSSVDMTSAISLVNALNSQVTSSTATTTTGGDSVKLEKSSDKINLGNGLTDVWGTAITKSNLPTLLKDGVYYNKQNSEYKYTQKVDIGNFSFSHFSDSDYNDREPTLGIKLNANTFVANYTLDFVTDPESSHGTDLTDFENKNIEILGKNYYILDFKNSTAKITLLDSAVSTSLVEGESKTVAVGSKNYAVSIKFVSTDEVILNVDGVDTEKLSATGTSYGNTYKLPDGTYVGVRSINVQNYAGGSKSVDFSIGKGKLEVTSGSNIKINDKSLEDVTGTITLGTTSSKRTWQKLVISWTISDKNFLTSGKELVMPGFEAIKFSMANATIPSKEVTMLDYGSSDYIELKTTLKDGDVTIPLMYISTTTGNISDLGQSSTQKLATTNNTQIVYNATSGDPQYEGFIASWNNTREAESYYLKATVRYDSDGVRNLTTIKNKITGDTLCEDVDPSGSNTCTIGNVVLTVNSVAYTSGADRLVTMSINSGGSFSRLYTKDGLTVYLPYLVNASTPYDTSRGALNRNTTAPTGNNVATFTMWFSEADKDGTLGQKNFQANVTYSGSSTYKTTVTSVGGAGTAYETETSSKIWESYIVSDLATRLRLDKTNSDQYGLEIEYHGTEVYANLFLTSPSTSVGTTPAGSVLVVTDAQIATVENKNLIVVGGSCINSVANKIVDATATAPICGADFTTKTTVGTGQYLIKAVASPYNSAKTAVLVAGYEAADTTLAVNKLKEGVATTVGTSNVYPQVTA